MTKLFFNLGTLFICVILISCSTSSVVENTAFNEQKKEDDTLKTNTEPTYYNQNEALVFEDKVYLDNIKTAILHKEGSELNPPIILLNSNEKLFLTFDDINDEIGEYYYEIIHCTHNWNETGLSQSEYLHGFPNNYISDFENSFNTRLSYINYNLTFPDEHYKFMKSGNYLLKVYEGNDKDNLVITKRFMVYENSVDIIAQIKRPDDVLHMDYKQEVDFKINHAGFDIDNVFNNLHVTITQNNRWDNAITDLKPKFIRDNVLDYDYSDGNLFEGGNEFRQADMKSLSHRGDRIAKIKKDSLYEYFLLPDPKRAFLNHTSYQDLNGNFLIKQEQDSDSNIDAEYIKVHFVLPSIKLTENVYVFGALSNWQLQKKFRMTYSPERKAYELEATIKQGYYNFCYATDKDNKINTTKFEGSFYKTENVYSIYAYYFDYAEAYDRLIGTGNFFSFR